MPYNIDRCRLMDTIQTFFILMFAAIILVGIAQKINIPYPLALILGGTALGFIPSIKPLELDPHLLLVIVLPPILYYAAFSISFREFKNNWREIFSLALGLVAFTTLIIGLIFKWFFPELPWALAFAFGAIVSPPDAVAAVAILKRFSIGTKLLTILEGESLVNDASALILYRIAVVALLSGTFSIADASLDFIKTVTGGAALGFVLGYLIQRFSKYVLPPTIGVVFSFTIPYITFILADYLGVSGVLAVVINGLIGSQILLTHHSSLRRILGYAGWDIFTILMNCFVFVVIGLQLQTITRNMTPKAMLEYGFYAIFITIAMIVVRMIWVYTKRGIAYLKTKDSDHFSTSMLDANILGWSGMRGIVSLTAALALPYQYPDGTALTGRNEVVFITFCVILITLIIPWITLPFLIKKLKVDHNKQNHLIKKTIKILSKTAEDKIDSLHQSRKINVNENQFLILYFQLQRHVLDIAISEHKKMQNLENNRLEVIREQRKHLLEMWKNLEIDDGLLNKLEHELDVEETHYTRIEL